MASPILYALGAGIAVVLLTGAGGAGGAPDTERCIKKIGQALADHLRNAPPETVHHFANLAQQIGATEAANCLRAMVVGEVANCDALIVAAVRKDYALMGDPQALRGFAMVARSRGLHELADCYDQLAAAKAAA